MSDIQWIEPRKAQLLVHITKREETEGGIVVASTAQGYEDIQIVKAGPEADADLTPGRHIVLAPGTYMVEIIEAPGYAYVAADQVIGFDNRTKAERVANNSRLVMMGAH